MRRTNHKHGKVKFKALPVGVKNAHDGMELQRHTRILNLGTTWRCEKLHAQAALSPRKIFRYPEYETGVSGYGQNTLEWSTRPCLPDRPVVGRRNKIIYICVLFIWLLVQRTIIDAMVKYTSTAIFFSFRTRKFCLMICENGTAKGDSSKYGTS